MPSSSRAFRQAIAVAVVVVGCATSQEAPETYAWAPVRPPAVPGTGLPTHGQPGQVRPQPLPRSPHTRVLPPTPEPGLWAGDTPRASQELEADPTPESAGSNRGPPAPLTAERRNPQCEPIPVPHAGEDDPHNECADKFPPNRYPGKDVLVGGKRFDALQVGVRVLWEIKTHQFDTYTDFLRRQVIEDQVEALQEERAIAVACGYDFVVGVSSAAHKEALRRQDPTLKLVVTGCKR